jgi:outer membrane murein-binding lipoprotein Lpp
MTIIEMSDERSRALLKNLEGTGDQRKAVELDDVLLGIFHRLDDGTSKLKAVYDRVLAIENDMRRRGSRGGFVRYLVAVCIGVAATLAWHSYGEVPKQIIAARAPELGWSPETKQMIASWVQPGPESTAVRPSVPETRVATVAQTVPAAVVPKAVAAPSIDSEHMHHIAVDLATLGQTVDQLAASQDQMVHQIDMLQSSNQEILASNREILERIPAPPLPPPTVAPTQKPTMRTPPSSRAPISRPYP